MKIKNIFLFVALFSALASNVKADSTNNASPLDGLLAKTRAQTSVWIHKQFCPAHGKYNIFSTKDGWSMPNQFKADETVRANTCQPPSLLGI